MPFNALQKWEVRIILRYKLQRTGHTALHTEQNTLPPILTLPAACTKLQTTLLDWDRKNDASKKDPKVRTHGVAAFGQARVRMGGGGNYTSPWDTGCTSLQISRALCSKACTPEAFMTVPCHVFFGYAYSTPVTPHPHPCMYVSVLLSPCACVALYWCLCTSPTALLPLLGTLNRSRCLHPHCYVEAEDYRQQKQQRLGALYNTMQRVVLRNAVKKLLISRVVRKTLSGIQG